MTTLMTTAGEPFNQFGLDVVHDQDGIPRVLAAFKSPPSKLMFAPRLPSVMAVPRDKWEEERNILPQDLNVPILDQDGTGSCVGHGWAGAVMMVRALAGLSNQELSACWLYAQINGGRDAGAIVGDAVVVLTTRGICLATTVPEGMIYRSRIPSAADLEAANFTIYRAFHVPTYDEKVSAILQGGVVVHGITVGRNYTQLDQNGVAPLPGWGGGGHCQYSYGVVKINNQTPFGLKTANSWSQSFGVRGTCILTERHFDPQGDDWAIFMANPSLKYDPMPSPVRP